VAASYRVPVAAVVGRDRSRSVVAARQVSIYLAHVLLGRGVDELAEIFERHHSTVTHACHRVEDRRDEPKFDARVIRIEGKWDSISQAGGVHGV
jgi:chromosomal replication initiation ATPase DnaA